MKKKTISGRLYKQLCVLLNKFDTQMIETELEIESYELLEKFFNEWDYIKRGE